MKYLIRLFKIGLYSIYLFIYFFNANVEVYHSNGKFELKNAEYSFIQAMNSSALYRLHSPTYLHREYTNTSHTTHRSNLAKYIVTSNVVETSEKETLVRADGRSTLHLVL